LRLTLHRDIPEDAGLGAQWNALVFGMDQPQIFYTYEWALAVSRAYRAYLDPLLWLAYVGSDLVGVAALAESKRLPGAAFLLTAATADYCDFICRPETATELAGAVLTELKRNGYNDVTLANAPADSPAMGAVAAAAKSCSYRMYSRSAYRCARIVMGDNTQRQQIRSSVRKRVKQQITALGKIAPVNLAHMCNGDITESLPEFFRMHVSRFLTTGRVSNLVRPERREFLNQLSALLSAQGWAINSRLMLGDMPAAWNYGFRFAGTWFWYQPTVNNRVLKHSPGVCLLGKIVESACDMPDVQVVDLGLGAEEYKERFANGARETRHLTLRTSAAGHLKDVLRHRAAVMAARSPAVENFLRRQRGRITAAKNLGYKRVQRRVADLLRDALAPRVEVIFHEWQSSFMGGSSGCSLRPLDHEFIAAAAIRHCDDAGTQIYLSRAAQRLEEEKCPGYALTNRDGVPLHFCWTADFNGFYATELKWRLQSSVANSMLIFDCWTPATERGKGFYTQAISILARQLHATGSKPWIFTATTNEASIRGIEKAGFVPRFSIQRRRSMFRTQLVQSSIFKSTLDHPVFAA